MSEIGKRRPEPLVVARFEAASEADLHVSAITVEEIYFGIEAGSDGEMVRQRMESKVLHRVGVVFLDEETAKLAGKLRGAWKIRGTPVGYRDGLIAATARAKNLISVTRNVRHFDHVTGLRIENWFEAAAPQIPPEAQPGV